MMSERKATCGHTVVSIAVGEVAPELTVTLANRMNGLPEPTAAWMVASDGALGDAAGVPSTIINLVVLESSEFGEAPRSLYKTTAVILGLPDEFELIAWLLIVASLMAG